jgi:flagellar protein FliJ
MQSIANIAKANEDKVARQYATQQQTISQNKQQLDGLHEYRDGFYNKLDKQQLPRATANQFMEHQLFLSNLNGAISEQKKIIEKNEGLSESIRQHWLNKRKNHMVLQQVTDNISKNENIAEEKAEQKSIEDLIQMNHGRKI